VSKVVKLLMITENNNNKFYNMHDNDSGYFTVEYGRVGNTSQTQTYPISKWNSKYNSKIKKGYKDITELFIEESNNSSKIVDIENNEVAKLVKMLQDYAKATINKNYNISSSKVTRKQIEEAQKIINKLSEEVNKPLFESLRIPNDLLIQLYTIIPRKMNNVKNYLFPETLSEGQEFCRINMLKEKIQEEQDLLDTMEGQVSQNIAQEENKEESNILDLLGLDVSVVDNKDEIELVLDRLGRLKYKNTSDDISSRFVKLFKVENRKTRNLYDTNNGHLGEQVFFHGSRNQNWWNIIQSGLLIRPSNAVHTGSMFGDGIYFASKAKKSFGYTSGKGSYWANGSDDTCFLALYDVNTGRQKRIKRHDSSCYRLSLDVLRREGYDSVYAEGGADLRNSECIVYSPNQCTIKYLIQLR